MTTVEHRPGCLEGKLDRLENKVTCIQEELERFPTREDMRKGLERFPTREEMRAELSGHIGALHEWLATQFEMVMEAMSSKLTIEQAEETFIKRSECPTLGCR